MARNDAKDYNPDSILTPDYEPFRFDEIDNDDLFWKGNKDGNNPAYRKLNDVQGYNTQTSIVENFEVRAQVFQRI